MQNDCPVSFYNKNINYALFKMKSFIVVENRQYDVLINNLKQVIIPDSQIIYSYYYEYNGNSKRFQRNCDVILDPYTMTIDGIEENIFTKRWKERTGHHKRAYGEEHGSLMIKLNKKWKFDKEITKENITGNGKEYVIINNIDQHSLSFDFIPLPPGKGKQWQVGPFWFLLNDHLKVSPTN